MSKKEKIYHIILENKRISHKELSKICNLSLPTIRKITDELVNENKASYIYGGIKRYENPCEEQYSDFHIIAQEAVKLINEGDSIFLGPGKTVATMCGYLKHFQNLVVFTNSFYVIEGLKEFAHIVVVVIGGFYQRTNNCFSLLDTDQLPNVNISKMFISGSGVDPARGVYHGVPSNKYSEEVFAQQAQQVVLLADKSKFGISKPFVLMPIDLIHSVITTEDISEHHHQELQNQNINIILGKV
ncbi:MAG: DeoR/GlpR family DNA-binding transcription regulator [Brevinema sp.]